MSTWFSEYRVRKLAERIADRIAPSLAPDESVTLRHQLPALLMDELRNELPEFTPKRSVSARRDRDAAIRSQYTGHNCRELSARFGISVSMVFKIVAIR